MIKGERKRKERKVSSTNYVDQTLYLTTKPKVLYGYSIFKPQFSSVQDGIYELEKPHMRSTPSLRSFPNVVLETV